MRLLLASVVLLLAVMLANGVPLGASRWGGVPLQEALEEDKRAPLSASHWGGIPIEENKRTPLGASHWGGKRAPLGASQWGGMPIEDYKRTPLGASHWGGINWDKRAPLGSSHWGGVPAEAERFDKSGYYKKRAPLGASSWGGVPTEAERFHNSPYYGKLHRPLSFYSSLAGRFGKRSTYHTIDREALADYLASLLDPKDESNTRDKRSAFLPALGSLVEDHNPLTGPSDDYSNIVELVPDEMVEATTP